jgi:hypothetical protein
MVSLCCLSFLSCSALSNLIFSFCFVFACFSSRSALSGKDYCLDHHKEQGTYNYGLDYEIQKKLESKWDPEKAANCQAWIEALTKSKFSGDFHSSLKSGVLLCELINAIWPNTIKSISKSNMPFNQRENIASYLSACKSKGLRETDMFVTQDLFEGDNLLVVVDNICALGVLAHKAGWKGTQLIISGGAVQTTSKPVSTSNTASQVFSSPAYSAPKQAPAQTSNHSAAVQPASSSAASSTSSASGGNKFCGNCGTARSDAAQKFCGNCGNKL